MKGVYVLVIKVKKPAKIEIRSLGRIEFESGTWIYVGSAMGNSSTSLENRLNRHFRDEKSIHWHIDYLLEKDTKADRAMWAESEGHRECDLAQALASHDSFDGGPRGFGASDCNRGCVSHIFKHRNGKMVETTLSSIFDGLSLQPHTTTDGKL